MTDSDPTTHRHYSVNPWNSPGFRNEAELARGSRIFSTPAPDHTCKFPFEMGYR